MASGAHRGVSVDIVEVFVRLGRVRRDVVEGIVAVRPVHRDRVLGGGGGRVRGRRGALVIASSVATIWAPRKSEPGVASSSASTAIDGSSKAITSAASARASFMSTSIVRPRARDPRDVRASSAARLSGRGELLANEDLAVQFPPLPSPFALLARERGRGTDRGTRTRNARAYALVAAPRPLADDSGYVAR